MGYNILINGLPLPLKWKLYSVTLLLFSFIFNHNAHIFWDKMNYSFRGEITLFLIIALVIFSIGSKGLESFVIGVCLFVMSSAIWDFGVGDVSAGRKNVFFGAVSILVFQLIFGKISLSNLVVIIKSQLGVR